MENWFNKQAPTMVSNTSAPVAQGQASEIESLRAQAATLRGALHGLVSETRGLYSVGRIPTETWLMATAALSGTSDPLADVRAEARRQALEEVAAWCEGVGRAWGDHEKANSYMVVAMHCRGRWR